MQNCNQYQNSSPKRLKRTPPFCRCNGINARCKFCACAKAGRVCTCCLPAKHGKCSNGTALFHDSAPTQRLHSRWPRHCMYSEHLSSLPSPSASSCTQRPQPSSTILTHHQRYLLMTIVLMQNVSLAPVPIKS